MDKIILLRPNSLNLLLSPQRIKRDTINLLISGLALKGPVYVLDGGNCYDGYGLTRKLRGLTEQVEATLGRVQVRRAFTCRQLVTLLAEQPNDPIPVFILEPLSTFRDENVPAKERLRLLESCINELERLSRQAMVLVALSKSTADPEHLALLQQAANHRTEFEEPEEPPVLRLF